MSSSHSPGAHAVNPWMVLVVVCFAQFMVVLDATVVNVALPSIQRDLALSPADLQWVVNAYTLVFGGFLLLGGRAADLIGRRALFIMGMVVFTGASLANALAQSGEMLIIARGFQGLGGALVSPAALSIITTTFAEGPERTKALSIWGGIAAGGAAFGLLLGGILTETLSWEWVFLVNLPVGVGVIFAALAKVPESRLHGIPRHFDAGGAVTVTAGLMVIVYAIVKAEEWGWGSGRMLAYTGVGLALLAAFVAIELRSKHPLVRLDIFERRTLSTANAAMLVVAGGMFAMFFFASLYLQKILGFGPFKTGLAFLPVSLGIMVGAGASQQLINRVGVRPVVLTGMTVAAAGLILMSMTTKIDGNYPTMLAGLLPMAVGMGMTFVPLTLVATSGIENEDAGLASGLFNTSQQIGGALGLAILATLATDRTSGILADLGRAPTEADQAVAMVEGFQTAFIASSVLMVFGLLLVAALLRKQHVAAIAADAQTVPAAA